MPRALREGPDLAKRDAKIASLVKQGVAAAQIGERFGLSARAVRESAAAHRAKGRA